MPLPALPLLLFKNKELIMKVGVMLAVVCVVGAVLFALYYYKTKSDAAEIKIDTLEATIESRDKLIDGLKHAVIESAVARTEAAKTYDEVIDNIMKKNKSSQTRVNAPKTDAELSDVINEMWNERILCAQAVLVAVDGGIPKECVSQ